MAIVFCNLGIGAASLGVGALYLTIHKPIFGVVWTIVGVGWFGVAWLNWRTKHIRDRFKDGAP
jgi:hypothetical protein